MPLVKTTINKDLPVTNPRIACIDAGISNTAR